MKYNPKIVTSYWQSQGLDRPQTEYQFHPTRKWRFDFAYPAERGGVAVEVQGGIWSQGRHTRGAALKKEWEKLNLAAALGWRILYCEPRDVCTLDFVRVLAAALGRP